MAGFGWGWLNLAGRGGLFQTHTESLNRAARGGDWLPDGADFVGAGLSCSQIEPLPDFRGIRGIRGDSGINDFKYLSLFNPTD